MKVWVVEFGVDYEGSDVIAVLDHAPDYNEMELLKSDEDGTKRYDGSDSYYNVNEWEINERI